MDGKLCLYYKLTSEPKGSGELKTDVHIFVWQAARHTMCTSVFSFIPQENEKNQQSILKWHLQKSYKTRNNLQQKLQITYESNRQTYQNEQVDEIL